jgi:hypothetical protein
MRKMVSLAPDGHGEVACETARLVCELMVGPQLMVTEKLHIRGRVRDENFCRSQQVQSMTVSQRGSVH